MSIRPKIFKGIFDCLKCGHKNDIDVNMDVFITDIPNTRQIKQPSGLFAIVVKCEQCSHGGMSFLPNTNIQKALQYMLQYVYK